MIKRRIPKRTNPITELMIISYELSDNNYFVTNTSKTSKFLTFSLKGSINSFITTGAFLQINDSPPPKKKLYNQIPKEMQAK